MLPHRLWLRFFPHGLYFAVNALTAALFGLIALCVLIPVVVADAHGQTMDADAAQQLARRGGCFRCHSIEKRKKAPSYQEIAKKHKNKPGAVEALYDHITGGGTVQTDAGDEPHEPPPNKSKAEIVNVINWILSH